MSFLKKKKSKTRFTTMVAEGIERERDEEED
jgi:hypothetical protein